MIFLLMKIFKSMFKKRKFCFRKKKYYIKFEMIILNYINFFIIYILTKVFFNFYNREIILYKFRFLYYYQKTIFIFIYFNYQLFTIIIMKIIL